MNEQLNKNTPWEKDSKWLRSSRQGMWNADYFAFLVNHVWKLDKPARVIDFGCGIGYLCAALLPLLPEGSSYTGLDINKILLDDARADFADVEWPVEFIEQDLNTYVPEEKYDIAVCQTLLIHMPRPVAILEKMIQSVKPGGRVICIEPNWAFTTVGTYRHGMEVYSCEEFGVYQKIQDHALQNGIRDPYIGIKLPAYMRDLGLKNIDIRINDRASLTLKEPDSAKIAKDRAERRENRVNNPQFYVNMGLSLEEAERHVENILRTEDFEHGGKEPVPTVTAMAWLVSYGEK